jgi:Protein of unknown function (DUF3309)
LSIERRQIWRREVLMIVGILIIALVMAILGSLPKWSHSRSWGYAPTGGFGLVLVVVMILVLLGKI